MGKTDTLPGTPVLHSHEPSGGESYEDTSNANISHTNVSDPNVSQANVSDPNVSQANVTEAQVSNQNVSISVAEVSDPKQSTLIEESRLNTNESHLEIHENEYR